jgi:hypothetical protein
MSELPTPAGGDRRLTQCFAIAGSASLVGLGQPKRAPNRQGTTASSSCIPSIRGEGDADRGTTKRPETSMPGGFYPDLGRQQ